VNVPEEGSSNVVAPAQNKPTLQAPELVPRGGKNEKFLPDGRHPLA